MVLAIAASKNWQIKSADVKNAYLQGELLEREVFMEPPGERKKPGIVWKLRKAVYGMNDAGRKWFLKLGQTLEEIGCRKSKYDHCLFMYKNDNGLQGLVLLWVDDIFHAGTDEFDKTVMQEIFKQFQIGQTEKESFKYVGLEIYKDELGISLDQKAYIEKLEVSSLKGGSTDRPLDNEERKLLRRKVGQLNWAATQSRPDISFPVVEISTKFKQPTLADLKQVNKTITKIKSTPSKLFYPRLKGDLKIITYSDASFRNLPDQISSAG